MSRIREILASALSIVKDITDMVELVMLKQTTGLQLADIESCPKLLDGPLSRCVLGWWMFPCKQCLVLTL